MVTRRDEKCRLSTGDSQTLKPAFYQYKKAKWAQSKWRDRLEELIGMVHSFVSRYYNQISVKNWLGGRKTCFRWPLMGRGAQGQDSSLCVRIMVTLPRQTGSNERLMLFCFLFLFSLSHWPMNDPGFTLRWVLLWRGCHRHPLWWMVPACCSLSSHLCWAYRTKELACSVILDLGVNVQWRTGDYLIL